MIQLLMVFNIKDKKEYFGRLSSLFLPVIVTDIKSGLIIYANDKAGNILMRSADKLIGSAQIIPTEIFLKNIETLKSGEPITNTKITLMVSVSSEIAVEIVSSIVDIEGNSALVDTFISTQKLKDAYKKLHAKEHELDAIFRNSQVGIMYLKRGRFLHKGNQKLADIFGFDNPEQMYGISMEQLHLSYERFVWFGKHHYDPLREHESTHINYELRKRNGKSVWVSLSGKALDTATPADLDKGVLWILDDISDQKALEERLTSHNKRLQNLLQNINGISWVLDLKTDKFTYVSPNAKQILGYEQEEWSDFDAWKMMVHPQDRKRVSEYCITETRNGNDHLMEYKMLKKDGSVVWILDIVSLGKDEKGHAETLYGFIIDITKQKNAQLEIERDHKHLQAIVDGVHDTIMVIRDDYTVELMNNSTRKRLKNIDFKDEKNPKCYEISHHRNTPCDGRSHPCPLKQVIKTKAYTKVVHDHKDEQGNSHFVEIAVTPILDESGNCTKIIESARDITEHLDTLHELQIKSTLLDFQAHHDGLTGLPNRTLYYDRVEQAIQKAKRLNKKFVLFFIDLDHFKEVNDSLGHDVGDKILLESSKRLSSSIREADTLARLGGDEFTILLEDIDNIQDVSHVAQKIINAFHEPFLLQNHTLYLTCSIGISIYPVDGILASDLLKYADNAMYKAKSEGRDSFQFYTKEMTELAFERIMLESNIRKAIENDELTLYYQPQYNGHTKELVGMEALIRWEHPTLGIILPSKFIPLAEESSLIIEIDNWVMKKAMEEYSRWYKDGLKPGILSLNLAIKQLESASFLDTLQKNINETSFEPEWLKLEVLERDVMRNPQDNIEKLNLLHLLGVQLAIDDFGTGQSSLTYLKRFPLDQLKIDRSFVQDILKNEEDNVIVLTIIALAKALKLDIIAEGVETKEQLEFLLENGCNHIQGYYLGRPINTKKMDTLLSELTNKS